MWGRCVDASLSVPHGQAQFLGRPAVAYTSSLQTKNHGQWGPLCWVWQPVGALPQGWERTAPASCREVFLSPFGLPQQPLDPLPHLVTPPPPPAEF